MLFYSHFREDHGSREQEYQIRIADAIQSKDYQRACELYREYQNPYLREFKDFLAVKEFTEYADANGYGIPSGKVFGIDESLTAFEESYRNAMEGIENNDNNDIINEESIDEIDLQSDYGKLIDSQKEVDKYFGIAVGQRVQRRQLFRRSFGKGRFIAGACGAALLPYVF